MGAASGKQGIKLPNYNLVKLTKLSDLSHLK